MIKGTLTIKLECQFADQYQCEKWVSRLEATYHRWTFAMEKDDKKNKSKDTVEWDPAIKTVITLNRVHGNKTRGNR